MKKIFTISFVCFFCAYVHVIAQNSDDLSKNQSRINRPDSPADNMGFWMQMAKEGIVPYNAPIPFKPAEFINSRVKGDPIDQMSTDVCVLDETSVTQSENSIAIHPGDASNVLNSNNSYQTGSFYGADYLNSSNSGASWSGSKTGAGGSNSGDPAVTIGSNGRRYVGFITNANGQGVAWSDNGTTWNPVTVGAGVAYPNLLDKNHLMVDVRSSGTYSGYVYSAWTRFQSGNANNNNIEFSRSTNSGVSWSSPINISSAIAAGSHNQGVNIQTGPAGQVYGVWAVYDTWGPTNYFENAIGFARSTNGGSSFTAATRIHNNIRGIRPNSSSPTTNPTGKNMRVNSFPSMAVDISGGPYNGYIYVVWSNVGVPGTNTGTNVSVYCMRSTDGGTTWGAPVRVNQGTSASDYASFFPWITCDPVTGKLYCIFYDDRNLGSTSTASEVWMAYSENGGASWSDFRVGDVSFTPAPIAGLAGGYMGDYLGISARDGWVYPCWTDNRSGRALTYVSPIRFTNYCIASGGCDEYISNVQIGTINNSSGCEGYQNFTNLSTNIGSSATLSVTNGNTGYSSDQCGVWVDWNNDGDFNDANETIAVSGSPGVGPYTANISPPAGISEGTKTMRIRITYTGTVSPCGNTPYGEVEDYSIYVGYCQASGGCDEHISRVQLGTIDNITGCSGYGNYTGLSTNLGLTATKTLTVTNGNAVYSADQCGVWVDWNRDFDFSDANETIIVTGTPGVGPYTAAITPPAGATAGPVRMRVRITYSGVLDPCGSTVYGEVEDYTINLVGPNYWVGGFNHYWHQPANWSAGHIPIEDEDIVINNVGYQPVYVDDYPGFPNEACNHLSIGAGASVQVWDMALHINGDLNIYGALSMTDAAGVIRIKGNWNNFAGASGFTEGPGRVVFNGGAYHQYSKTETFNILEVNKPSGGAFRPYLGVDIVCAAYDWTAGAVDVIQGSFTANDLLDNGIFGAYYCNAGGTINLNNLSGNLWVDLNGELHIYGGTVNVSGSVSDWPYAANALIEMSDGVLDFKTCGISINNSSYTLTSNITGGVIRTAVGFSGNRADFTPTAGTVELYGSSDAILSQSNGSTLWDVNINKSAKNASIGDLILPVSNERIDKTAGKGGKANSVTLYSNISITDNLTITAGTLEIGAYTCTVARAASVYGTLSMTNPTGVLNIGTYQYDNLRFWPGSTGNLSAGNIYLNSWIVVDAGSTFTASPSNTIHIIGSNAGGGLANSEPSALFGNININKTINASYLASDYYGPYNIQGNFTVQPGNSFQTGWNSMHVNGLVTNQPTSSIYLNYIFKDFSSQTTAPNEGSKEDLKSEAKGGGLTIDTDFTLNGLLDVSDGNALVHGIFHLASTGNLNITGGSFIADSPLHSKGWEYLNGHLGMTSGLFEISYNSIQFSATGTSTVSGGIIRSGEAFAAQTAGNFQPTGGTVEIIGVGSNTIYCSNGNYFYNLLINRDPAALSYLFTNITVNSNLSVNSGSLIMEYATADVLGGVTVNGGNLNVNENGILRLASGTALNVNNGGKLNVVGSSSYTAKLTRISSGYYSLNVQSGGTIAAQYGTFEYMNTSGINLLSGSLVDPVYSFHNCTFQNGQSGGRLMSVENNQVFNVNDAIFPTNTWSGSYNVYKAINAGTVNFVLATGGFAGESYDYDPNNRVNWTDRSLSLKAYLEGPFNGTNMNTTLNGILPLSHPFNPALPYFGNTAPKWYYTGTGSVGAIPNVNVVDWVLVELRDAVNAASATPATSVAKIPAFILNNGSIVALNGSSNLQFSNVIVNNLYVVIYNRNHQSIMNANVIPFAAGVYTYDFTTGAAQVYGGTSGHKQLATGKWGMRSGDGNADGSTNLTDKNVVWKINGQLGKTGYLPSDFSFDRQTNNKDKNDKWLPNNGSGSQVPN